MSNQNPTGFDVKEYVRAASKNSPWGKRDPWQRNEAWRYTGPFTRWNRFNRALPGLGIATVAFAGYCVFEALFLKEEHGHGQDEGHGAEHH